VPEIEQVGLVGIAREQTPLQRLVGDVIADGPVELPVRPAIELQFAEFLIARRLLDRVVLVGQIIERHAPGG